MTQLRHPNCCAVYDYGLLESGEPFLTMELVPGQGLDEMIPLPLERVKPILTQLCLALGYVHQLGYVHSDLKSANVRVRPDGTVKLMDYGLMELAGRSGAAIRGTVGYLAPEVVKRGPIDRRTDLYALGCLAYELLTGQLPFASNVVLDLLRKHLHETPVAPSSLRRGVPQDVEAVVLKLLAKDPLDRFQSAYEVLEALGAEVPTGIGGALLTSPLIERDAPLEALTAPLQAVARREAGCTLLLTGEAGVGKTRLLEQFRFETQAADVLHVHATPRGAQVPYGPFVDVLRHALPLAVVRIPDVLGRLAPILVKLLPGLAGPDGAPVVPAPELDPPNREKVRLQDAVATLLGELAGVDGLVLSLDAWQRADTLSHELLEYVLRNTEGLPLVTVVAMNAPPSPPPAWMARAEAVALAPLSDSGVARMVGSMLGTSEVSSGFVSQLAGFSGGNPRLLEQQLEHLVRERVLVSSGGRWETNVALVRDQLPADTGALLLRQLEALPEAVQNLAGIAAVVGETWRLEILQAVAETVDDDLFDGLRALEAAQVVAPTEEGLYTFAHAEVQRHFYDTLAPERRQDLHLRALTAIEREVAEGTLDDQPIETVMALARHALRAQAASKSIPYALAAGSRQLALLALDDAEEYIAEGLVHVRAAGEDAMPETLMRYLEALGSIRRPRGDGKGAKEVLAEAIDLAEQLGLRRDLGRLLGSQAKAAILLSETQVTLEYAQRAVKVSEEVGDDLNVSRSLLTRARTLYFSGRMQEALESATRAAELAEGIGDVTQQGSAHALAGYFCVASSDPKQIPRGIELLEHSLALMVPANEKIGLINAYTLLGNAQNTLGDHRGAMDSFLKGRAIAYGAGFKTDQVVFAVNLAITALELGDLEAAVEHAQTAHRLSIDFAVKYTQGYAAALDVLASVWAGRCQGAPERIAEALSQAREIKNKHVETPVLQAQVEVLLLIGQHEAALAAARSLRELIDEAGNSEPESRLNVLLSEIHIQREEAEDATWRAELAWQAALVSGSQGKQVRALRAKADGARLRAAWDEVVPLAGQGLDVAQQIGARLEIARLAGILGEARLATGAPDAAEAFEIMLREAVSAGAPMLEAEALFGLAAARPYAQEALGWVGRARELIRITRETLPEPIQPGFSARPELHRILHTSHHLHGLPRRNGVRPALLVTGFRALRGRLD